MTAVSDFARWKAWDAKNPEFYELFKKLANKAVAARATQISGWWIANVIRWEHMLETNGSQWKVPNGAIAYFTRLFVTEFPQHTGLFETRPLKTEIDEDQMESWMYARLYPDDDTVLAYDPARTAHSLTASDMARVAQSRLTHDQAAFQGAC
jgi:hypothetical protein